MKKAYDLKVLGEKLKAKGLEVAEDSLKVLVAETLDWVQESAPLSASTVDDYAAMAIPFMKPKIMEAIDKIDGQVG
jgi:hypothetical protein